MAEIWSYMMDKGNKVISNFIWRFAERSGAQAVKLLVELILARLLLPDDYGTIALVAVFITILNVFVDSGMGNALIQKKDADDLDFSSVFYFNLLWCTVLYTLLFVSAPVIGEFYKRQELIPIVRVLGITILISGLKNVQQAYVSRNMLFRKFFFATLGGTIGAALTGIVMAYRGFGVWALVTQQLLNAAVDTLILWITVKWRPKRLFSIERLMRLFSYGWKLLASGLLDTVYTNIRALIIGKIYSSSDLAYYNQGDKLPNVIVGNINSSIDSVLLPTMSQEQDDAERVKVMTRRAIKTSTYIMAPLMIGLAVAADNLIRIILTEKWIPCVVFLRIFCITYMFQPIHTANLNAIKALGRSDLFLKLEMCKKVVGMTLLLSTMWISVEALAYSSLIGCVLAQIINSWPNRRLLYYGYIDQLKDIMPSIGLALLMGLCIYPLSLIPIHQILIVTLQVIFGALTYIGVSYAIKLDAFMYLLAMLKKFKKKRKERI
ncbi:lipopolysaccharide biosynthesis protein [Lachnospiraceae bacterium 48-42]